MIVKHTLFLGLNDKDKKVQLINTIEAYKIVMNLVCSVGYDGASVSNTTGFYKHDDGSFVVEESLRIEILFADDIKTDNLIHDLKRTFNQESVALQIEKIESKLV